MKRDEILEILEQKMGSRVSGEQLSRSLGVSRTAVWKQIKALRELGYRIAGSPRTGYLLEGVPDLLYPREIRKGLGTRSFGQEIFHFRRVGSTNQVAFDLARRGYPEGTVVVAEEQTSGRGRWQRPWFSPPETGIWLSLILRPDMAPVKVPQLTLVAGAACARAIHGCLGFRPAIKWPNDLLYNGKKLCGILVEMEAAAEQVHFLVIGIGINVNQEESDFPPELRETAASLRMVTGSRVARVPLVRRILEVLEEDYRDFCSSGFTGVRERWLEYETTLGKAVQVRLGEKQFTGTAEDLDAEGNLLLRLKDGKLQKIISGELTLCRQVDN
ncbi:MAG TPA: biotin--[acetyl-CoA-carboxylase] ligase [Syntrophomonadaceae bacterium]|nr:biotin--[acetyl-CoA-carboxylase] ligase [Syntrophomonadaceae bacterium]